MAAKKKAMFKNVQTMEKYPDTEGANAIAAELEKVADGMKALKNSRLTDKAILLLISHASGVPQRTVADVLDAAANLKTYLRR